MSGEVVTISRGPTWCSRAPILAFPN